MLFMFKKHAQLPHDSQPENFQLMFQTTVRELWIRHSSKFHQLTSRFMDQTILKCKTRRLTTATAKLTAELQKSLLRIDGGGLCGRQAEAAGIKQLRALDETAMLGIGLARSIWIGTVVPERTTGNQKENQLLRKKTSQNMCVQKNGFSIWMCFLRIWLNMYTELQWGNCG